MIPSLKSAVFALSIVLLGAGTGALAETSGKSIFDTASSAGNFSTLLKALQTADMEKVLKEKGPLTVFAPDDAAFAKLPPAALNDLLSNKAKLANLLKYHIVRAKVVSREAARYGTVETLEGDVLAIRGTPNAMTVETANVVKPDIPCSNGYIQEIDTVLMPTDKLQ
jgi:uncharacterized surface protein with fasciclin (FAS1) repeats